MAGIEGKAKHSERAHAAVDKADDEGGSIADREGLKPG